jgi:chromosome segregation ATPase
MPFGDRYLCDVLKEMRKCFETRNFSGLLGLIEEAQMMGNRMESAINGCNEIDYMEKRYRRLKREVKKLEDKRTDLEEQVAELEEKVDTDDEE